MTWVQGLQGVTLIAVICGLLFVEEIGVPLFFAPGDLVLAISGIAVAAGRVSPVMLVPAVLVACAPAKRWSEPRSYSSAAAGERSLRRD